MDLSMDLDAGNPEPLKGSAVWTAGELASRPEWNHRLGPEEQAELLALASSSVEKEPAVSELPLPILARRLAAIREQLENGAGAVRIQGFPLEGLSETQAGGLYGAMIAQLGHPVSQSAKGERIYSVRDAGFGNDDPRSRGPNTSKKLSFHTDRSDVVGFLCLRQARVGGENEIASSMAVYNEIRAKRPDLLPTLLEPFYYLRHTVDTGNQRPWCRQPVFSFRDGFFACCLLRVLIERAHEHPDLPALSRRQVEALDLVESVASSGSSRVVFRQQPGDLVFLNNWLILHKRGAFTDPAEPERKRHILRAWLSMPNSRPLDRLFLDNYGAVGAGEIRGGMRANR